MLLDGNTHMVSIYKVRCSIIRVIVHPRDWASGKPKVASFVHPCFLCSISMFEDIAIVRLSRVHFLLPFSSAQSYVLSRGLLYLSSNAIALDMSYYQGWLGISSISFFRHVVILLLFVEIQAQHRPSQLKKPRTESVGTDRIRRFCTENRMTRRKIFREEYILEFV